MLREYVVSEQAASRLSDLTDQGWSIVQEAIDQLEAAWGKAPTAVMPQITLPPDPHLRRRVLIELIKVDQEFRLQAGQSMGIEQYLEQWPELDEDSESVAELWVHEDKRNRTSARVTAGLGNSRNR